MHIYNRADGFIRVFVCIFVMRDFSRASHELRGRESKKAKLKELSNNISEKRCKLKANEPVNERSD